MRSDVLTNPTDARRFYLVLGCLIVVAWGFLIAWQGSAFAELIDHEAIEYNIFPLSWRLGAVVLNWILMTVAMMLPGSLPLLNPYARSARQQVESNVFVGLIILGYLLPWVLFGLLLYLGDSVLHRIFAPTAPLSAFSGLIAPAIVLIAGLYQFTPLKRRHFVHRQPVFFLRLKGNVEKVDGVRALKEGLRLGFFCLGSCWSLMLLMFALGHDQLGWMLAIGWIMAAERLAPWGRHLSWLVGITLVVWATFWALI